MQYRIEFNVSSIPLFAHFPGSMNCQVVDLVRLKYRGQQIPCHDYSLSIILLVIRRKCTIRIVPIQTLIFIKFHSKCPTWLMIIMLGWSVSQECHTYVFNQIFRFQFVNVKLRVKSPQRRYDIYKLISFLSFALIFRLNLAYISFIVVYLQWLHLMEKTQ